MTSMTFAVTRVPGPAWDDRLAMRAQAGWDTHALFMDDLTASGFILMGGPLAGKHEVLLIVVAENEQQIRQTLQRDPWEPAGILTTQSVRQWTVLMDSRKSSAK